MQQGEDESDEGCLSHSRLAQNGRGGTWWEIMVQVRENLPLVVIVGKGDIAQAYAGTGREADRFPLFLQGRVLQFHESFGRRECADEYGHEARHLAEGTLYLSHQLDECQHHAVGYGTLVQAVHSPQESDEVPRGKSHAEQGA